MVWRRDLPLCGLSAVLFLAGTGLTPLWWATWLAPLPVLLLAFRASARVTGVAAFAAWLAGEAGLWSYYTSQQALSQPMPLVAAVFLAIAGLFAAVVLGARALLRSGRPVAAALFVPAAWTVAEFAVSMATPNGLFWSLAYTQAGVLPVAQTASVAGPWGITFLVTGLPAAVAVITSAPRHRLAIGGGALALLMLALGYGGWRLHAQPTTIGVRVAVVALEQPFNPVPVATPAGADLLARYVAQIRSLAAAGPTAGAGAAVVVLPEKAFQVDDATLATVVGAFSTVAAEVNVTVVAGMVLTRAGVTHNAAMTFVPGRPSVEYDKHHLIPVLEDSFTAGNRITVLDGGWGVTICKDLDYPALAREFRRHGTRALLVPAWDFDRDAWLHSRMAVLRGIENGLPMARAGRNGAVTITDPYGRVLVDERTAGRPIAAGAALMPAPSAMPLYTRWGDWLPWSCLLGAALLAAGIVIHNSRSRFLHKEVMKLG